MNIKVKDVNPCLQIIQYIMYLSYQLIIYNKYLLLFKIKTLEIYCFFFIIIN